MLAALRKESIFTIKNRLKRNNFAETANHTAQPCVAWHFERAGDWERVGEGRVPLKMMARKRFVRILLYYYYYLCSIATSF